MNNKFTRFCVFLIATVTVINCFVGCTTDSSSKPKDDTGKSVGVKDQLNQNGIRPDVEAQILKYYPKSEIHRAIATQFAFYFQKAIENPENALEIFENIEKTRSCQGAIEKNIPIKNNFNDSPMSTTIITFVMNSYARNRAFIRYNARLSGHMLSTVPPNLSNCKFKITE